MTSPATSAGTKVVPLTEVANAGGSQSRPGPIEEISEEAWRASVDANLTTTFLTIKCFLTDGNCVALPALVRRLGPGGEDVSADVVDEGAMDAEDGGDDGGRAKTVKAILIRAARQSPPILCRPYFRHD